MSQKMETMKKSTMNNNMRRKSKNEKIKSNTDKNVDSHQKTTEVEKCLNLKNNAIVKFKKPSSINNIR